MYRLPNLLIVGVQKCGTTYSHTVLSSSPDILGSTVKELNFFNKKNCLSEAAQDLYSRNFEIGDERYYMESTPHYFRLPHAPGAQHGEVSRDVAEMIDRILPRDDRKLIVILRNPVERAISAMRHHIAMGRLPVVDTIDSISDKYGILNRGFYSRILRHWRPFFGESLQVFFYDRLLFSPNVFFGDISDYLGIDSNYLELSLPPGKKNSNENMRRTKGISPVAQISTGVVRELIDIYRHDIEQLFQEEGVFFPEWFDAIEITKNLSISLKG